jgi:hypothetical protein
MLASPLSFRARALAVMVAVGSLLCALPARAVTPASAPAVATPPPLPISDENCPFAVVAAKAFIRTSKDTPGDSQAIRKSALEAAQAYASCQKQLTKERATVPAFLAKYHHAEVREAQYHLAAGRNDFILGDGGSAEAEFRRARELANDVVTWAPPSPPPTPSPAPGAVAAPAASPAPKVVSRYYEAAGVVRDEADKALAALEQVFASPATRAPQAAPTPA